MHRRSFLTGLVTIATAPRVVEAQPAGKVWRVGLFHVGLDHEPPTLAPLREGLKRLGYEDKNIRLDWRNQADEDAARVTARAFVRGRVDLIVAFEAQAVRATQAATSEIPVVFVHVGDPVASGFVKSIAQPGGNLTGIADFVGELQDKRMQILGEIVRLQRLLILTDPLDPNTARLRAEVRRVAPQLKVELVERQATTEADVTQAFAPLKRGDVDGLIVVSPNLITKFRAVILRLCQEHQIPLAAHAKVLVEHGALLSYGPDNVAVAQDLAGYIDKILKGAKPADLPVQQAARLELVINMKTAKEEATNVAFFERMRELGYFEGQTVVFDRRFATGRIEQLSAFATQIVAANPDVIFAPVTPAALAARKVTKTIPIVFAVSADPIDAGLVTSLREPGGNITGIISMNVELAAKRLELLRQVAPRISRIAVFSNLDNVPDR